MQSALHKRDREREAVNLVEKGAFYLLEDTS